MKCRHCGFTHFERVPVDTAPTQGPHVVWMKCLYCGVMKPVHSPPESMVHLYGETPRFREHEVIQDSLAWEIGCLWAFLGFIIVAGIIVQLAA